MAGKVEIFEAKDGEYYYRVKASNGETLCRGEGYKTKSGAKEGVEALKRALDGAALVDLTEEKA